MCIYVFRSRSKVFPANRLREKCNYVIEIAINILMHIPIMLHIIKKTGIYLKPICMNLWLCVTFISPRGFFDIKYRGAFFSINHTDICTMDCKCIYSLWVGMNFVWRKSLQLSIYWSAKFLTRYNRSHRHGLLDCLHSCDWVYHNVERWGEDQQLVNKLHYTSTCDGSRVAGKICRRNTNLTAWITKKLYFPLRVKFFGGNKNI